MNFPPKQPTQPPPTAPTVPVTPTSAPTPVTQPTVALSDADIARTFSGLVLDAHSTRILFVTFGLIVLLAILGLVLSALLGVNDDIFHDAIRIIGIGGPASASTNAIADVLARRVSGNNGGAK